ncbi:MAG: hypothetical protein HY510_04190 [Acidobacteria bacterium]|nr:hypothetical protein [Acidobacteriota bacterium]
MRDETAEGRESAGRSPDCPAVLADSRATQDIILRLLADGPLRAAALDGDAAPEIAVVMAHVDAAGLERFGRFLCRHYYRERIVHFFRYARALEGVTGRAPEAALKTAEFKALIPRLVLGERASARLVLDLLERHLTAEAGRIRALVPYWDDLTAYQGALFLCDALPPARPEARAPAPGGLRSPAPDVAGSPRQRRFPGRSETAAIVDLEWDLPEVLPLLLRPFEKPPVPPRRPTRLLFARSVHGEVTALRCTDALKRLLEGLTGEESLEQAAARMNLDRASLERAWKELERLGAVEVRD